MVLRCESKELIQDSTPERNTKRFVERKLSVESSNEEPEVPEQGDNPSDQAQGKEYIDTFSTAEKQKTYALNFLFKAQSQVESSSEDPQSSGQMMEDGEAVIYINKNDVINITQLKECVVIALRALAITNEKIVRNRKTAVTPFIADE